MRWILRIALVLLTLVVLAIAALFLIPTDRIARLAEAAFEQNTGRKLVLSGEVRPRLLPHLGISLGGATISNADWAADAPMLEAGALNVAVSFGTLLGRDIVVEAFTIDSPVIRLERDEAGRANWDFLTRSDPAVPRNDRAAGTSTGTRTDTGTGTPGFSLPKATITNGTLVYADRQSGQTYSLTELDATLTLADLAGAGQLDMSARMNGQAFTLGGGLDGVQQLLDGAPRGVDLNFAVAENSVSFKGTAGLEPVQAKGAVDADLKDIAALAKLIGVAAPAIPQGLGRITRFQGDVTLTAENQVFLRNAILDLDQNRLQGDVDVMLAKTPRVRARFEADQLDLSALGGGDTGDDGAANSGTAGWSQAVIDVNGLNAVDAEFTLRAAGIDLGAVKLGATDIAATLDNARLVFDLRRVAMFAGQVTGQFVVNNRNGLSIGGNLEARDVAMQQVLQDFAGYDRLVGRAGIGLNFLASGNNMDRLMRSLSGSGSMDVGAGELLGLDIAGMIRNLDTSFRGDGSKTIFKDITASFAIDEGILRNDDLRFVSEFLTASGAGIVDIGGQQINYRVEPLALATQLGGGISVPVIIEGPWSNVRFRPDLKSLIDTELAEEKARLKAAARQKEDELKARAARKLQEELGVTRQDGQSLEDTLKQGLEDKARDQLRKLFGGN